MLAGGVTARLPTTDDLPMAVGQLAQQIQVLVVDIHWPRTDTVDVDRVLLGGLSVRLPLGKIAFSIIHGIEKGKAYKVGQQAISE